jgi:hypothetical protein
MRVSDGQRQRSWRMNHIAGGLIGDLATRGWGLGEFV